LKYWSIAVIPLYKKTALPGRNEELSGSCIGGYNVAASIYSSKEKQEASLEFIKFITSKEIQKEFVMNYDYLSGIPSLYDDEEVCSKVDCELYKSVQPAVRPTIENENYDDFSLELKSHIYEYLFGNKTVMEVLKKAEDLTKIYSISVNTQDTSLGLIFFIISTFIICLVIFSTIFIFVPKFKPFYKFLPNDFWIISMIGLIMILCINFTEYGEITVIKCHLRIFLLSIGFSLNMIPVLYKLIISFPDDNKVTIWVQKHRYIFLLMFILIDVIMNLLFFVKPYTISKIRVVNGQNFQFCKLDSLYGKFVEIIFIVLKFLVFFILLSLMFLEWNMKNIYYDIRFFISAVYIDALDFILFIMMNTLEINNYKSYFILREIVFIIYAITTCIFLFGYRIIYCIFIKKFNNDNDINSMSNSIRKSKTGNSSSKLSNVTSTSKSSGEINSSKRNSSGSKLSLKVLDYHYRQEKNTNSIEIINSLNALNSNINSETAVSTCTSKSSENFVCISPTKSQL